MTEQTKIHLKEFIDHLKVGAYRISTDGFGRFMFVNSALCQMLGYPSQELAKINAIKIFEGSSHYQNLIKRICKKGYLKNETINLKRKDGVCIPCLLTATLFKDTKSKTSWINGIVEDISIHKQAQKELFESKALLKVIFDNSAVAITVTDKNEKIVAWNPFAEKLLGMSREQLFNMPVKNLYSPLEWRKIRAKRVRTKGILTDMETRVICRDGKTIDVDLSISIFRDVEGKIQGAIGIMHDITKRKVAEKRLKDNEEKIRIILNNSAAAITLLNDQEEIISWNQFTEDLLGMTRKDLFMKHVSILYPKQEWEKIRAADIRKIGSKHHIETKIIKKDRSIMDVDLSVNVLKDSANHIIGSVGIMQDITEQKRVREELIQAKIVAEEANNSKSLFLANVSHEVRTPMNAIIGMVDMTLDTELTTEQKENLQTVKDAADNLLDLLNDILDLSRIEAGKINLEIIEFNIRDVIKNVCRGLHVLARNKNLELLWSVEDKVPELFNGDPVRLRQIIINLINNAIKFTSKGKVEVTVFAQSLSDQKCELVFSILDSGIGIPKDKQEMIFDAFVQADDSITRRYGGTGLGLAISKRLVELMGGRIWVESKEGEGSKFSFTASLAIAKKDSQDLSSQIQKGETLASLSPADDLPPLRVLLAEDNIVSQRIVVKLLSKKGWTVLAAENGQEVLGLINTDSFDVILMDVQMPILDGLETTRLIRQGEKQTGKHIPIIAMTARAMEEDKHRCLSAGMDGYVSKPVDRVKLFATIREFVKKG